MAARRGNPNLRPLLVVLLVAVLACGATARGGASTGAAGSVASAECRVPPRSLDALVRDTKTPERPAADPTPGLPPNPVGWLEAEPAAVAGAEATVREFVACRNAGDAARAAALLSDAFLRRLAGGIGGLEAFLGPVAATPAAIPPERHLTLRSIEDFGRFVDGRIGAIVVVDGPAASAPETVGRALYVFVEADGRYLIDHVLPLDGRA